MTWRSSTGRKVHMGGGPVKLVRVWVDGRRPPWRMTGSQEYMRLSPIGGALVLNQARTRASSGQSGSRYRRDFIDSDRAQPSNSANTVPIRYSWSTSPP